MMSEHHFLVAGIAAWGHVRPLSCFTANFLLTNPSARITFCLHVEVLDRVRKEIGHCGFGANPARLLLVPVGPSAFDVNERTKEYSEHFALASEAIMTCSNFMVGSGLAIKPFDKPPSALLFETMAQKIALPFKRSFPGVPLYCLIPPQVPSAILLLLTQEEYMGKEAEYMAIPELPEMYHYEIYANNMILNPAAIDKMKAAIRQVLLNVADGLIMLNSPLLYPAGAKLLRDVLPGKNTKLIYAGAQHPSSLWQRVTAFTDKPESVRLQAFLDKAFAQYGPKSVLYATFGSLADASISALTILVECLEKRGKPYIIGQGWTAHRKAEAKGRKAESDTLAALFRNTTLGYLAEEWVEQEALFQHEALGWAIIHCGMSTFLETIISAVPTICWPFVGDQVLTGAFSAEIIKTGFQLFQIRAGLVGRPIRSNGIVIDGSEEAIRQEITDVLIKLGGSEGELRRSNVERISQEVRREHQEHGTSMLEEVFRFVTTV